MAAEYRLTLEGLGFEQAKSLYAVLIGRSTADLHGSEGMTFSGASVFPTIDDGEERATCRIEPRRRRTWGRR